MLSQRQGFQEPPCTTLRSQPQDQWSATPSHPGKTGRRLCLRRLRAGNSAAPTPHLLHPLAHTTYLPTPRSFLARTLKRYVVSPCSLATVRCSKSLNLHLQPRGR